MIELFDAIIPSGSTGGKAILLTSITSPGTTLHTTGTSASQIDFITVLAKNNHTAQLNLFLLFGGTADPADLVIQGIPPKAGYRLVTYRFPLAGDGTTAKSVTAYAETASLIGVTLLIERGT